MGYLGNVYPKEQAKEILYAHSCEVIKLLHSQFPAYWLNNDLEDVYFHLIEKISEYNSESALSTFIVTYARQYLLNKQSRKQVENRYIAYCEDNYQEADEPDLIFNLEYKEMKNVLHNMIESCDNESHREILRLHFQQSYQPKKIAKLTNLRVSAVRSVIHRFVDNFKSIYSRKGE